jgi:hypothetical protein
MWTLLQVTVALLSWFLVVIAPAARLAYEDRNLSQSKHRGVSILPGWPLLPMLFLLPMSFLGAQHIVMKVILCLHGALFVWAIAYLAYWTIRTCRAG